MSLDEIKGFIFYAVIIATGTVSNCYCTNNTNPELMEGHKHCLPLFSMCVISTMTISFL